VAETWLKSNQRALLFAMVFPFAAVVAGGLVGCWSDAWLRVLGLLVAGLGLCAIGVLAVMLRRPVLALEGEHLLVFLSSGEPERVPIEFVEFFFRGEGPVSPDAEDDSANAANIVVRLAERAVDWKQRKIKSSLGQWCDGYITIRGMWCEPIDRPLLEELNRRLVAVHRQARQERESTS